MTPILKQPTDARALLRLPVNGRAETSPAAPASATWANAASPAALMQGLQDLHAATETKAAMPVMPEPTAPAAIDPAVQQAELDALREQARREGYAEGRARAEHELRHAMDAEAQHCRRGIDAMHAELSRKLQALEPLAVAVGYEALARVLGRAYADGSGIEHAVRRLLDETAGALNLRVQLPPAQLQRVQAAFAQHGAPASPAWQFEADAALGEHECRIVSERGQLETSLALQLDAVRDALLDAASASTAEGTCA